MLFSFLDFYRFNSNRKLKSILLKFGFDYDIINNYLDYQCIEDITTSTNDGKDFDCRLKDCLNHLAEDEGFANANDLLKYSELVCSIIFFCNLIILIFEFVIIHTRLYSGRGLLCLGAFLIFSILSFEIIKPFYPILELFKLTRYNNKILRLCYSTTIYFNTVVLLVISILTLAFLK